MRTDNTAGALIEFTFFWKEPQQWEGRNYSGAIHEPQLARCDTRRTPGKPNPRL